MAPAHCWQGLSAKNGAHASMRPDTCYNDTQTLVTAVHSEREGVRIPVVASNCLVTNGVGARGPSETFFLVAIGLTPTALITRSKLTGPPHGC